jgi:hypothetical protein
VSDVNTISKNKIWMARIIAVSADILQIGLFPLFGEGFVSPLADVLDVVVCGLLTALVGWHFVFLPSFVVKVLPVMDLAPTWTIAILIATRQKVNLRESEAAKVFDNGPAIRQLKAPENQVSSRT